MKCPLIIYKLIEDVLFGHTLFDRQEYIFLIIKQLNTMKTLLHLKKSFWILTVLLLTATVTYAQNCENFDTTAGAWQRSNIPTGGSTNSVVAAPNNIAGSSGVATDFALAGNDTSGSTILFNQTSYTGSFIERGACFCYDFLVINNQQGQTSNPRITIYQGDVSTFPRTLGLRATFTFNQAVDENDGWVRICAPIEIVQGNDLPSNDNGSWSMPMGQTVADWNTLINNVDGVFFSLDLNSNPTERYGYDNICFDDCPNDEPEPTNEGAYCCDESENLLINGNFEFGDVDFVSGYDADPANLPGQYQVTNDASLFGTTIIDHSFCEDPTLYANNDQFLLVNGLTNQPAGSQSTIWGQQLFDLDPEQEYRFCGNFKNIPQCTFDVVPTITIRLSDGTQETFEIDTNADDPCDWQNVNFCFTGLEQTRIDIILNEGALGDGNDLAIDDLSLQALADPNLSISVLHQGNPQNVTGSIYSIDAADDALPYDPEVCDQPYFWFVGQVTNYTAGTPPVIDTTLPYGWGNASGYSLFSPASSGTTPWDLTTNFPGYTFENDTLYAVGMFTRSCCTDCVGEGVTFQLIYNSISNAPVFFEYHELEEGSLEWIETILGTYAPQLSTTFDTFSITNGLNISPNPAQNNATISIAAGQMNIVEIYTVSGQLVTTVAVNEKRAIDINTSSLKAGVYMVKALTTANDTYTSKLIIK